MIKTRARHLLVEYHGCDREHLNDVDTIRALMRRAAEAAGATVVAEVFHPYRPQGVTGVVVIEESHFSVHTWPECGYAAVDFYTCGECEPQRAAEVLHTGLRATRVEALWVERGMAEQIPSIRPGAVVASDADAQNESPPPTEARALE